MSPKLFSVLAILAFSALFSPQECDAIYDYYGSNGLAGIPSSNGFSNSAGYYGCPYYGGYNGYPPYYGGYYGFPPYYGGYCGYPPYYRRYYGNPSYYPGYNSYPTM
ncbi:hypothetical protein LSTR_LSTR003076 [Laodelphax striatellus]|uniref:Uncharacterized protein n=1 Tax=Laodelphax striatellus TaxID=195883 RepID=A0A482WW02_LAOST|nr:hypothetical protein LSTR_LSTR003076 [Laodelphax striatellus]